MNNTPDYENNLAFTPEDNKPTYYVTLSEYNEVKNMFLKANKEISRLKDLLKECREKLKYCTRETYDLETKINEVLK